MPVRGAIVALSCLILALAAAPAVADEADGAKPAAGPMSRPERVVTPFDKTNPLHIQRYYDQLNSRPPVDRDGNPFPMGDGCLPPAPWLPLLLDPKVS